MITANPIRKKSKIRSPFRKKPARGKASPFARAQALAMANATLAGNLEPLRQLAKLPGKKGSWSYYAARLIAWLDGGMVGKTPFTVFAKGNSKLPFSAFSATPIVTCPGAGACMEFCYSLTAWRYPAAYFRQLQNALLFRSEAGKAILTARFMALPAGVCRLYVDGDFSSKEDVIFWMGLVASRPDIQAYGYSKSWLELIQAHLSGIKWPSNYLLNLSSGSKHDNGLKAIVARLPIARGEFVAVRIDKKHIQNRSYQGPHKAGWKEYEKAVRGAYDGRLFVCRGKCGTCLPDGAHACGAERMRGVTIGIGVH